MIHQLNCKSCGAELDINDDTEIFSCGYCGSKQQVDRRGGVVQLRILEGAVNAIKTNTDKTAAELAIVRLEKELKAGEQELRIFKQSKPSPPLTLEEKLGKEAETNMLPNVLAWGSLLTGVFLMHFGGAADGDIIAQVIGFLFLFAPMILSMLTYLAFRVGLGNTIGGALYRGGVAAFTNIYSGGNYLMFIASVCACILAIRMFVKWFDRMQQENLEAVEIAERFTQDLKSYESRLKELCDNLEVTKIKLQEQREIANQ